MEKSRGAGKPGGPSSQETIGREASRRKFSTTRSRDFFLFFLFAPRVSRLSLENHSSAHPRTSLSYFLRSLGLASPAVVKKGAREKKGGRREAKEREQRVRKDKEARGKIQADGRLFRSGCERRCELQRCLLFPLLFYVIFELLKITGLRVGKMLRCERNFSEIITTGVFVFTSYFIE